MPQKRVDVRIGVRKQIIGGMVFFLLLQGAALAQQVSFTDVTETMKAWGWRVTVDGVKVSAYGHGAAFADVTGDSIPDLYISSAVRKANGKIPETLYIGQPGGAAYSEEDGKRGCSDSYGMTGTHGISFFDYDNDGDFDIFNATTDDRNRLYRNVGGYFTDVTDLANIKAIQVAIDTYGLIGYGTRGVVAFDADNNGYMDLLGVNWGPVENINEVPWVTPAQPNEFYYNNGNGTFTKDDSRGLTLPFNPSNEGTQGVTAADVNGDGWMDIFICHRNYAYLGKDANGVDQFGVGSIPCPNQLLINDGTGHFIDETKKRGLYDAANDINGATFADFDNDGDLDLFMPPKDITERKLKIYENDGSGYFTDISSRIKIDQWGFSSIIGDFNNDGFLDLFDSRSYGTSAIYLNTGTGNFTLQATAGLETAAYDPRGGALADVDGDGDLDIYYADANKDIKAKYSNRLFRNNTPHTNHWLKVTGRGPKGDAGGFGTKIWVFEAGAMDNMTKLVGFRQVMNTYGYLCQDDPVQHFGLGSRTAVDVKVRFLDGTELKMGYVAADRKVIFTRPQQISLVSGNQQNGAAGQTLAQPLRIKVTDEWGKAVRGAAVDWTAAGGGTIQPAARVYTGSDGIAAVTCIVGGSQTQQQVRAASPDFAATVDFEITNSQPIEALISRISGSGQSGEVSANLPRPLVAKISLLTGAAASQFPVVLKVTVGGGKVNGADSAIVLSGSDGLVQATWQLGLQPGSAQQVKAYLPGLPGQVVYFDAVTYGVAATLQWLSALSYAGTAGKALPDSLAARVLDNAQQPVQNFPVDFSVTTGGGLANGSAAARVLTNSQGIAKCQWQLGTQSGSSNQTLHAAAGTLQNSPIVVTASTAAGSPNKLSKTSGDAQSAAARAAFSAPLVVTASDTFGNPVSGQAVRFEISQGSAYVNDEASVSVLTASDGRAQVVLKAGLVPGPVFVRTSAAFSGRELADSPLFFNATVTAPPHDPANGFISASSPVMANNREQSAITVQVRDAGNNPVAGAAVTLFCSGANNALRQPTAVTNALGQAFGSLISTRAEVKKIWAEVDGVAVSRDSARAVFVSGPAARMMMVSGNNQIGFIGRALPAPAVVALFDSFDNPVSGAQLAAVVQMPDGRRIDLAHQPTDSQGISQFIWTLSQFPGTHELIISYGALPMITFLATAQPVLPSALQKVSGDDQVGLAGQPLSQPLVVRVIDEDNLPLANVAVTWSFVTGSGSFPNGATVLSGSDGISSAIAQPGAAIGTFFIQAQISGLEHKVTFMAMTRSPRMAYIEIVSGDGQSGRELEMLGMPLTLRVLDELRQPVAGALVKYEVVSGSGKVLPDFAQASGVDGMVSARWTLGSSGEQSARAWLVDLPAVQTRFNASLRANQAPALACPADTTIAEGGALSFWVHASDPEGDPIHLSALDMPAHASLDTLSGIFSWNPGFEEAGIYRITFLAVDSFGGTVSRSCRIQVQDVRRPLQILMYAPAETLIVMDLYKPYTFEVTAFDPDGDSLYYEWTLNNLPVGTQATLRMTTNPSFPARSRVSVRVYTRQNSTILSWSLDIRTGVATRNEDPESFILGQNYPNPFNPTTHIPFQVGRAARVSIAIYNQSGQLVRRLYDGAAGTGWHQAVWDARDEIGQPVPSGTYYCRMESESFQQIKKLLLLK